MASTTEFASPRVKLVLDQRVKAYLADKQARDRPVMYVKAAFSIGFAVLAYMWLVYWSPTVMQAALAGFALACGIAAVGFNVQHDANHGGFSRVPAINKALGLTLDLAGASSYFWADKHNHNHHVYTNISLEDADLQAGDLVRFSEDHKWRPYHRYQYLYIWALYCAIHYRYLYSDFQRLWFGKADGLSAPYPKGWHLVALLAGKAFFFTFAFIVPLQTHSVGQVIGGYLYVVGLIGLFSGIVFQSAHSVDNVDHPRMVDIKNLDEWVVHQIRTTSNFAPDNRFWTTVLGGLNYQREHHLFPKINHIHYPAISRIVKQTCDEYGIAYCEHPTFGAAIRSHYRFLRALGTPEPARQLQVNAGV